MITEVQKQEFYQALLDKNTQYEGVFFVGVQTTEYFVVQHSLHGNQNLKTVNFIKQLRKHY
jgi:methylphosphotriester-DNA--protein-cysteine methyltransferase